MDQTFLQTPLLAIRNQRPPWRLSAVLHRGAKRAGTFRATESDSECSVSSPSYMHRNVKSSSGLEVWQRRHIHVFNQKFQIWLSGNSKGKTKLRKQSWISRLHLKSLHYMKKLAWLCSGSHSMGSIKPLKTRDVRYYTRPTEIMFPHCQCWTCLNFPVCGYFYD